MELSVRMICSCKSKLFCFHFFAQTKFFIRFSRKVTLVAEAEKIITNTIVCTICGGAGHVPSDCKFRRNADGTFADPTVDASMLVNRNTEENQKLDCEVRVYYFRFE